MPRRPLALVIAALIAAVPATLALANASHKGWPPIQHHQINRTDANLTINAVPGLHNELLGGHGNDTINGGDAGDVIWGDYKPCCQPTTQIDRLNGGAGNDFIYASHGTNYIFTGAGRDVVHAHFGRGEIHCGTAQDLLYLSHQSRRVYKLFGCKRITYKSSL